MSEWKDTTLGALCVKIGSGATPTGGKSAYCGSGISLIRSQNVLDFSFSEDGLAFINDFQAKKLDGVTVKENDVLLNITGDSVARVCIVPQEYLPARVNQHVAIIRPQKDIFDYAFCLYLLQKEKKKLLSLASTGGTRNALTKNMLEDYSVSIPDFPTQRRIAAILSSLDAKIENNNKVNAKLEEIAQNLFKEWFVDFGPFKDGKFVDSELGPIPEGWRVGSVYEYVNVIYGAPYKSDKFNENGLGLPVIRIRDLKTGKPQVSTEEILPQTEYVEAGDIVAGMDAEFIPFIWKGEKGLLNQRVCKLKPQIVGIDDLFVMYLMLPHLIFTQSYKVGTTVSHIGKSDFDKFVSVLPPLDIVLHFSEKIAPMRSEIVRLSKETRELATLRDTLLPKLMSGEIEV